MEGNNLEDKQIKSRILSMVLPITVENILQMTAGLVLMAMIGRINPIAVGSIGIAMVIYKIVWAVFKGIGTGASVLVAQSYGGDNFLRLKSISEQAFIIAFVLSILFQQLIYWNAGFLLKVFNPTKDLLLNGTIYLKTISWSFPSLSIIILVAGVLQGMGNAKTPMIAVGILNVINIVLGYVFIFVMDMGLRGAGYAYNIAYASAAVFGLIMIFGKRGILTNIGGKFNLSFDIKEAATIMRFGLPTSFETAFWQMSSIFITRAILTYGEIAYAAYQLGLQAESISYMPATGFSIAATTFTGQSLGGKDKHIGKKYLRQLMKITIIITIIAGSALIFIPNQIMRLLTDDVEVIKIGAMYLIVMGVVQLPQNISGVLSGALRGAGHVKIPMINAGIGLWVIRVPFVLAVAFIFKADIIWIWVGIGLDMCFRLIFSYFYFRKIDIFDREAFK
ncbi:MAG: MATE family efflux transporter [Acholeplasma sp.]|nr:MATE family efflux transporter [Acholeplasma sp.]